MNSVCYPQKKVWAHKKLDTENKDEIVPYLKESINEPTDELLVDHNSEEYEEIKV